MARLLWMLLWIWAIGESEATPEDEWHDRWLVGAIEEELGVRAGALANGRAAHEAVRKACMEGEECTMQLVMATLRSDAPAFYNDMLPLFTSIKKRIDELNDEHLLKLVAQLEKVILRDLSTWNPFGFELVFEIEKSLFGLPDGSGKLLRSTFPDVINAFKRYYVISMGESTPDTQSILFFMPIFPERCQMLPKYDKIFEEEFKLGRNVSSIVFPALVKLAGKLCPRRGCSPVEYLEAIREEYPDAHETFLPLLENLKSRKRQLKSFQNRMLIDRFLVIVDALRSHLKLGQFMFEVINAFFLLPVDAEEELRETYKDVFNVFSRVAVCNLNKYYKPGNEY